MYVSSTSETASNPIVMRALRRSRSRDGFLKARRDTPCAIAALAVISASPELALAYRSTETSPSSALTSQRGTLRLAVFALVAAECTLHFLSSSRNAPRKHMGLSASDFASALTSAWGRVSEPQTDELFENNGSGLSLGKYGRLRVLSGLTLHDVRVGRLTHQALQMAVARSLLVRATHRIVTAFETYADDAAPSSVHTGSEKLFSTLCEELSPVESEIRRARSIVELLGAKASWPVIRATFALCHVASQPGFAVDDLSNTFPLYFKSIGRTPKGMATAIKKAVAQAGSAREFGLAGELGREQEKQSRATLRKMTDGVPAIELPASTAPKRALTTKPPRAVASDLRAALVRIMRSMRAAEKGLFASEVLAVLSSSPLPNVHVLTMVLTTGIEQFHERPTNMGTKKGTIYDFVIKGNALSCSYGAFNNTVHELRELITKDKSQPD